MSRYTLAGGAWAVAGVAVALFGLGYLVQAKIVYLAGTVLLGVVVHAAWFRAAVPAVELSRTVRTRVGSPTTVTAVVRNPTGQPLPPATVRLDLVGLPACEFGVPRLGPGESFRSTVEATGTHRAGTDTVPVTITQWSLFRVASRTSTVDLPSHVRVHPVPERPVQPAHTSGAGTDRLSHRPGTELDTVREWVPGDSRRAVQWRATARHGSLIVADRRDPQDLVVQFLVLGQFCRVAENALAVGTATIAAAAAQGGQVRCVSFDQAGRPHTATSGNEIVLGDWVAMVGGGAPEPLRQPTAAEVERTLLPRGELLVLALPDAPAGVVDALRGLHQVRLLPHDGMPAAADDQLSARPSGPVPGHPVVPPPRVPGGAR